MKDADVKDLLGRLKKKKLHIVTAESLTGGLISATLTRISGASETVLGGPDVYQDRMKTLELDVPPRMLEQFTAVSSQVAKAMVEGAFRKYNQEALGHQWANVAVAVTGYASDPGDYSPNGSADTGLVYIGIGSKFTEAADLKIDIYEHRFDGDRDAVRAQTVDTALGYVVELVK